MGLGYQEKCLKAEEDLDKLRKAKESESASLNLQVLSYLNYIFCFCF